MGEALYDKISEFYLNFVKNGLEDHSSVFHMGMNTIFDLVGTVKQKKVCDLACGEGYFSRALAERGAHVTGVDISSVLLEHARQRAGDLAITYIHDDAQSLTQLADQSFDLVVCNMALMDIPDIGKTLGAVHRVLSPGGSLAFAILHPCFESPFHAPDSPIEVNENGEFVAIRVMHYLEEGHWNSGGDGMRGRVGAYHRTISTYVNALLTNGFQITGMAEPAVAAGDYRDLARQKGSRIPPLLVVKATTYPLGERDNAVR
jgi:2-polyprenyl-3-methyl-5-hydroxy-6-metoxy-1,4-benzoquinol methylase